MVERTWNGRRRKAEIESQISRNVRAATLEGLSAVQRKLRRNTPSGEVYRVPNTNRLYRASAPGEPPANRTGSYANSWESRVRGEEGFVGTKDKRGPWLELGTKRMAPRPHLEPALMGKIQRLKAVLSRTLI